MLPTTASDAAPAYAGATAGRRHFVESLRAWEILFLVALFFGILLGTVWGSRKAYLGNDELVTAILVSNPSFSEMWSAIRRGGELNPPLYFVLEWCMVRLFGPGELALRLLSSVGVALGGWVLYFAIRPMTGPRVAALAIALVLGLSRDVFNFAVEARYYGVLFLVVSLGIFLLLRLTTDRPLRRRDYVQIFLVHGTLVYLHLYGLIYSGVLFVAMAAMDLLRGRLRWGPLAAVVAAWISFCAWLPATFQQFKSVAPGVWTPPNFLKLGYFFNELQLQMPLALVALLVLILGCLALLASRPCRTAEEVAACSAREGWAAMGLVSLALLSVPVTTWLASHVMVPPPFMRRYMFPCTTAYALMLALMLVVMFRAPALEPPFKVRVSPRLCDLAWAGVLIFCVGFQPFRSTKDPPRAAAPFAEIDFGHANLPVVFEDSWYFVQWVYYGQGRETMLLVDRDAAEADRGWYTKATQRLFEAWHPRYHHARVAHFDELPEQFLAVEDDANTTFDWIFAHHPELTKRLLATRNAAHFLHGDERVYLVQKPATANRE